MKTKRKHKEPALRIRENISIDPTSGCWNWKLYVNAEGYGSICVNKKHWAAHRFSYVTFKKNIPKGLVIDHLCRNTSCVNPDHLEPVTNKENIMRGNGICVINARKTHCKRGHAFTKQNTLHKNGNLNHRTCRACASSLYDKKYQKEYAMKKRAAFDAKYDAFKR